jgi:uncharacterized protein YukE
MPQEFTVDPQGNTQPSEVVEPQGQGYINTSSQVPTDFQQGAVSKAYEAQRQVQELSEKLGVNLGDVQPQQQPAPEVPQPEVPQEDPFARFNTAEGQRMREEFKKVMGIDPLEAFQAVQQTQQQLQQVEQWRQQVAVERQMDTLKQEWGGDFEATFSEVRERFNQLPDHMKPALDNLDGARLLAAQIRSEQLGGQHFGVPLPRSSAPSRTSNIRSTGAPVGFVKTSDYLNDRVSEAEYISALQAGRVIRDI